MIIGNAVACTGQMSGRILWPTCSGGVHQNRIIRISMISEKNAFRKWKASIFGFTLNRINITQQTLLPYSHTMINTIEHSNRKQSFQLFRNNFEFSQFNGFSNTMRVTLTHCPRYERVWLIDAK